MKRAMNEKGELAREEAWAMVAVMFGVGALGTFAGLLLDRWLGTRPWLLLSGALAGLSVGLLLLIRMGLEFAHRQDERR